MLAGALPATKIVEKIPLLIPIQFIMWIHNTQQSRLSKVSNYTDKALVKSVELLKINGYPKNIILYVGYPNPFCAILNNLLVEKNAYSAAHFQILRNSRFHDAEHKLFLDTGIPRM